MSETAISSVPGSNLKPRERFLLRVLSRIIRLWQDSLRYEGLKEARELLQPETRGSLILIWHNRMIPGIGAIFKVGLFGKTLYTMSSYSRDGDKSSYILYTQGIMAVRGSSSRKGAAAARALTKVLNSGDHVALTIDGPRGPLYVAQPGGALLMQLTGSPVFLVGVEVEDCWVLDSWDRFILPKPFSRVRLKVERHELPDLEDRKEQREELERLIQRRLEALTLDTHLRDKKTPRRKRTGSSGKRAGSGRA